ncbi:MAG TPA: hypothetical protein VEC57_20810 [Candidatus Limnocylindrales bacterium]|nr:hypothetical protein [Candidatus Limnocylindrales bacterium]
MNYKSDFKVVFLSVPKRRQPIVQLPFQKPAAKRDSAKVIPFRRAGSNA